MNQSERILVGEMWIALTQMFGKEITGPALSMMLNSVSDMPFVKVERFMKSWAMKSKIGRHPYPSEIREFVDPTPDHVALALEATGRVIQAIGKFGLYEPAAAKEWIGSLGWRGIKRFGGWAYLCENLGLTLNQATFTAQLRDILKAQLDLGDMGIDDEPIMITTGQRNPVGELTRAGSINFLGIIPAKPKNLES
jgi:hypothetical protein